VQKTIRIGNRLVGEGQLCYIVAEIGINHNGDIHLAKQLIDAAVGAQCDAVKFQKRTVDVVYTRQELAAPRESPFGKTNGDLKRALEFSIAEYEEIDEYCRLLRVPWFVSCWDENSVNVMRRFDLPCFKIASACLTDDRLLAHTRKAGKPVILSTGMSTLEEIDHAVNVLGREDLVLLQACSAYPALHEELNLRAIQTFQKRYQVPTGYSGHETGFSASVAALALGACMIERHITMDRGMWGSDHAVSLEPKDLAQLVREVRLVEEALGDGIKRVNEREYPVLRKLRRVGAAVAV
jgi:N-acetylneuraminate synthase